LFHGAYRAEVFEKVGLFNEKLLRTEDNEMHYRIRRAGYKICFDPDIVSYQYARSSLKRMLKQKYGNGHWIGLTLGICPGCISLYHLVPFCFVMGILGTSFLAAFGFCLLGVLMWGAYGLLTLAITVLEMIKRPSLPKLLMPFLLLALHVSYGLGTLTGLLKLPVWKKKLCKER
jgi:cellulose synthase/poly-beta-1,6-N-acetylglucosamine synthase-like glycosyltransferase